MIYLFLYIVIGFVAAIIEHAYAPRPELCNPGFTVLFWPGLLFALICAGLDRLILKVIARCKS